MSEKFLPTQAATPVRPETRASRLGGLVSGMGKIMHMEDYIRQYPGSKTALLAYIKLDTMDIGPVVQNLSYQSDVQEKMGRDFWPQVSLETSNLGLSQFRSELNRKGSKVERNTRMLAREIARYRDRKKWFFIRPFSEMNDSTPTAPWEFGSKVHKNTPQEFVLAWKALHQVFDEEGATNAIFVFSPLAAYSVHKEDLILATLNLMPPGQIDAFGLNVYSRPMTAYGGTSPDPITFETLTVPWLLLLAKSKQHGIPLACPEMGVSNQASDERRAIWLKDAFKFARSHGFVLMTYFNYPHRYWQIDDQTKAGVEMAAELNSP